MKRNLLLFLSVLMLACQPTPEAPVVVQKDSDRLIETVRQQSPESEPSLDFDTDNAGLSKSDKHYTFDYESDNGCLVIHADADVYLPERGKISMAHVEHRNFTEDFMKKAFGVAFGGETAYVRNSEVYVPSKEEIATDIAGYQELIDSGRTWEKDMTEDEALAYIEELKEQFKTAPDEPIIQPPLVSDGSVQTETVDTGLGTVVTMSLNAYNDSGSLWIYSTESMDGTPMFDSYLYYPGTSDSAVGYSGGMDGYSIVNWYSRYQTYRTSAYDTECSLGQSFSPAAAVDVCTEFLKSLDVTDMIPYRECSMYLAKSGDEVKTLYILHFVRTAAGSATAYVPSLQSYGGSKTASPWPYEEIEFIVDDTGILRCIWTNPTEVTEIVSTDVKTILYEDALRLFEQMCVITYEGRTKIGEGTQVYYGLNVRSIELSMLRVRERNGDAVTGLYVPAWIFYGTLDEQYFEHHPVSTDNYETSILFAINAIDGSVIDINEGY